MSNGQALVMIVSMVGLVAMLLVPTYQSIRDGLMLILSEKRGNTF